MRWPGSARWPGTASGSTPANGSPRRFDPARREIPVLTIALEAGFHSIGPFNRAFKALMGMTPTEFRRQNIADS
jgi:hypothetical protein